MVQVLVRHKVKNYSNWKTVFDNFIDTRKSGGEKSWKIWHPDDDPNNLWMLFEWDNINNAHSFFDRTDLKDTMNKAGVIEQPDIFYLKEYDHGTV
ncbi:MAG: cyclase [Calditrichota bacterium]|jgi:hypothetical protein